MDQLYRQNAELQKEVEEIMLILRKSRASCFEPGEVRYDLQEWLDAYKAGEEKRVAKLTEEAEVETK